ncbi:MAG: DUF2029 domain-containing protein [Anaerolineae bacterium]|nr:DUF2029 domain-containing protein [Anaerolineae bacterium]
MMNWNRKGIRRIWWGMVILGWAVLVIMNWVLFMYGNTNDDGSYNDTNTESHGRYDYFAYAKGAQALVDGRSPYDEDFAQRHLYLYPPLLAQALAPFVGTIGEPNTAALWYMLNIACLIGIIQIMRQHTQPKYHIWLWAFPVLFIPITHTLYIGQITIMLTFLFMLTWRDYGKGKHFRAGGWLALACWIKVFPVFIVLFFILRRDWRVMRGVIVVGVGLGVLQILISGLDMMIQSFSVLLTLFTQGQTAGMFQNSSIAGFTGKLFVDHPRLYPLVIDNTLFQLTRYGLMLLTVGVTYALVLMRRSDTPDRNFDLAYGAVIMMALLVGYTLWITGMPPYFLAFWMAFRYSKGRDMWILVVAVAMLAMYLPLIIDLGETRLPWWSTYSIGFYATYTLWGMLVYKQAKR